MTCILSTSFMRSSMQVLHEFHWEDQSLYEAHGVQKLIDIMRCRVHRCCLKRGFMKRELGHIQTFVMSSTRAHPNNLCHVKQTSSGAPHRQMPSVSFGGGERPPPPRPRPLAALLQDLHLCNSPETFPL